MSSLETFSQVRTDSNRAVTLVGYQGERLEDQHELFERLEDTLTRIELRNQGKPYLVIMPGLKPFVGIEATTVNDVPTDMLIVTIPEDHYAVFRFEKAWIGAFWETVCTKENQLKYRIDLDKPRFEMITPELQAAGAIEWYIPTKTEGST